jgi:hypothetical protein
MNESREGGEEMKRRKVWCCWMSLFCSGDCLVVDGLAFVGWRLTVLSLQIFSGFSSDSSSGFYCGFTSEILRFLLRLFPGFYSGFSSDFSSGFY